MTLIPKGVPFTQIPNDAITDLTLTPTAFRVFAYLFRRANDEHRAWPSHRTIADDLHINKSTVGAAIRQLGAEGWIEIHQEQVDEHKQRYAYTVYGTRPARLFDETVRSDEPTGRFIRPVDETARTGRNSQPDRSDKPDVTINNQHPTTPNKTLAVRNAHWDALVALFGEPSNGQRTLYGRVAQLVQDWPPEEIPHRAGRLAEMWGPEKVTVASLEKHWSRFDAQIGNVTAEDVAVYTAEQERAATIARLTG